MKMKEIKHNTDKDFGEIQINLLYTDSFFVLTERKKTNKKTTLSLSLSLSFVLSINISCIYVLPSRTFFLSFLTCTGLKMCPQRLIFLIKKLKKFMRMPKEVRLGRSLLSERIYDFHLIKLIFYLIIIQCNKIINNMSLLSTVLFNI